MTTDGPSKPNPPHDGGQIWWRILPMLFFSAVAYIAIWFLFLGALLQYLSRAFTGEYNSQRRQSQPGRP